MMVLGTNLALIAIALLLAGDCWFLWEVMTAPEGWEDQDGFHLGREP